MEYASFFLRIIAVLIDIFVLYVPLTIIDMIFGPSSILSLGLNIVLWGVYTSYLLSGSWKSTVGKKVLGLEVVGLNMEQLTFKEAIHRYVISLASYTLMLPLFLMFFTNKKQTFHDYYAKTIVVDKYKTNGLKVNKEIVQIRKYLMRIVCIVLIVFGIPLSIYAYYFIGYAKSLNEQREYAYKIIHNVKDYNNTTLDNYQQKLMGVSKVFIEKNNEYLLFKSKVQEEILLDCVRRELKLLGDDEYFRNARYFVKNVRNRQIYDNEEKIKTVKKNEKLYFKTYSKFDFELIQTSLEQVKVDWGIDMCKENTLVDEVYQSFLFIYLSRQHYDRDNISSNVWLKQFIKYEPKIWESFLRNNKDGNNE